MIRRLCCSLWCVKREGQHYFFPSFSHLIYDISWYFKMKILLKSSWILIMKLSLWKIVKFLLDDKENKCTSFFMPHYAVSDNLSIILGLSMCGDWYGLLSFFKRLHMVTWTQSHEFCKLMYQFLKKNLGNRI